MVVVVCCAANAERRVALVIGNGAYKDAALDNSLKDATDVSRLLRQLDFDVILEKNLDKLKMEAVLRRFAGMVSGADVAFFYYAGHAIQLNDRNYLIPTSATENELNITTLDTLALQDVSEVMQAAGVKVQLLVLDACRDNPFGKAFAPTVNLGRKRGLAPVTSPVGTLVAFSTSPGMPAFDGGGLNSPFTEAFLRHASLPKLEIRQVLSRIRADVVRASRERQIPWDSSSLVGDFFLVPPHVPPAFERNVTVEFAPAATDSPLRLKRPRLPDGGSLSVSLISLPARGSVQLNGRALKLDETVSADEFESLAYRPAAADAPFDDFSFRVDDSWGNSVSGHVSLRPGSNAPVVEPKPRIDLGSLRLAATSTLGIGPNLAFEQPLAPNPAVAGVRLRLVSNVPIGQFSVKGKVVDQGRSIAFDELPRLAYLPSPGTGGARVQADFEPLERAVGKVRLSVQVTATECDLLAGARFDPQGVTEGVTNARIDTAKALPACERAVAEHPEAGRFVFQLGRVLQAMGRTPEAVARFQQAIERGHIRARSVLASMYADGSGVAKDLAVAKRELEAGIRLDDVGAVYTMAKLYVEGQGVARDLKSARELLEKAARVGYPPALTELGVEYALGRGVKRDTSIARRYFEEASRRGDIYATQNLGTMYLDGIGTAKNPTKAMAYFKQAADLGHPEAPNNIGRMYFSGLGVAVNPAEAVRWYKIGSDRGDAWASVNLARLALAQKGALKPVDAAVYFARSASFSQLDAAVLGRKQLSKMDRGTKLAGLRQLVSRIQSPASAALPEAELLTVAKEIAAKNRIALAGGGLDDVLVGCARADWLKLGARTDLF